MTVVGQLDLLELLSEQETAGRPVSRSRLIHDDKCRHCGEPVNWRYPSDQINHGDIGGTCMSRDLTRIHALQSLANLDQESREERGVTNCFHHPGRKQPCTQECFEKEHDENVHDARRRWGGDGWQEKGQ